MCRWEAELATKNNPLKLNKLQLKTLTLLQEIAKQPVYATPDPASGDVLIQMLPEPHGDHFHVGSYVVAGRDASGLANRAVWLALFRKGLVSIAPGGSYILTAAGVAYETGIRKAILHGADHEE
jgi:hypothetical protein